MGVLVKNGKSYTGTGDLLIQPVIYSDDERCIGVWRDGKPLYQKSFNITAGPAATYNTYLTDVENVENVVYTYGFFIENSNLFYNFDSYDGTSSPATTRLNFLVNVTDNKIRFDFRNGTGVVGLPMHITVQYTKTTDTAGTAAWVPTGATPIHYSLNEQVIGTWIDGKPLYQKSFVVTESSTVTISNSSGQSISGFTSEYASQIAPTIDKLIDAFTKNNMSSSDVLTSWPIRIKKTNGYIFPTDNSGVSYINYNINPNTVITIQYTKTTD